MGILSNPAFGPRTALIYITVGALMDVWTAVWYFVFIRPGPQATTPREWFWLIGLFLTGLTLMTIGLLLGPIGRAARRAELPPPEATAAEASVQQAYAAAPQQPVMMPGNVPPQTAYAPAPQPPAPVAPVAPVPPPGVALPRA